MRVVRPLLRFGRPACVSQHLCPVKWLAEPELEERRVESRAGIAPAPAVLQTAAWTARPTGCKVLARFQMPATRLAALCMGLLDRLFKKERPPAIAELVKAAEQGDREAQCKLGFAYADGEGVTQDFEQACRWFALAAEQSHPEAQFSIGVLTERQRRE